MVQIAKKFACTYSDGLTKRTEQRSPTVNWCSNCKPAKKNIRTKRVSNGQESANIMASDIPYERNGTGIQDAIACTSLMVSTQSFTKRTQRVVFHSNVAQGVEALFDKISYLIDRSSSAYHFQHFRQVRHLANIGDGQGELQNLDEHGQQLASDPTQRIST